MGYSSVDQTALLTSVLGPSLNVLFQGLLVDYDKWSIVKVKQDSFWEYVIPAPKGGPKISPQWNAVTLEGKVHPHIVESYPDHGF